MLQLIFYFWAQRSSNCSRYVFVEFKFLIKFSTAVLDTLHGCGEFDFNTDSNPLVELLRGVESVLKVEGAALSSLQEFSDVTLETDDVTGGVFCSVVHFIGCISQSDNSAGHMVFSVD